ncbi:hypothetical protein M885DRAFT_539217 [Pelagophyceae sp. CCMP2097]|nr:hypothetical protein M885DRAFT_539217 [Pelagophyceae sp. CCMP2097]
MVSRNSRHDHSLVLRSLLGLRSRAPRSPRRSPRRRRAGGVGRPRRGPRRGRRRRGRKRAARGAGKARRQNARGEAGRAAALAAAPRRGALRLALAAWAALHLALAARAGALHLALAAPAGALHLALAAPRAPAGARFRRGLRRRRRRRHFLLLLVSDGSFRPVRRRPSTRPTRSTKRHAGPHFLRRTRPPQPHPAAPNAVRPAGSSSRPPRAPSGRPAGLDLPSEHLLRQDSNLTQVFAFVPSSLRRRPRPPLAADHAGR